MISERYSRQSFIGEESEYQIKSRKIGIVGLGGGGSHIAQQLAHIGFGDFVLYDPDTFEESNLNRTVGSKEKDVRNKIPKVNIAKRLIKGIKKNALVKTYKQRWQENSNPLRECDIIFGCVDGYQERHELEVSARRYFIPYIDIGLTVVHHPPRAPLMSGHVFLSLPNRPCMWCLGILSDKKLGEEALRYGDTGPRPQVIWANGVLASTAAGIAIDLVTGWTQRKEKLVYLLYEGNPGIIAPNPRLAVINLDRKCPHHDAKKVGDPQI